MEKIASLAKNIFGMGKLKGEGEKLANLYTTTKGQWQKPLLYSKGTEIFVR